jgi:hypothetical protein
VNVPVGNLVELPFYFSKRELTVTEDEHFFDPDRETLPGLPLGVGFKPPETVCEYKAPGGDWTVIEGAGVIEDAEGEYHAIVLVPMGGAGVWEYRGRGVDGETPVCSTPRRTFTAS